MALAMDLMKKENAPSLDQLFGGAGRFGVRIKICGMSRDRLGPKREEIIAYGNDGTRCRPGPTKKPRGAETPRGVLRLEEPALRS
jgi:hypothetical protein